jgi:DNA invertase Pin-like site-specific DNA recombinase
MTGRRTTMSTKVALYYRVSTRRDQTTENQRIELRRYCERQGWQVAGEYDDSGVSGAKGDRSALAQMMQDAARGRFKVVCVWKIDRLARSVADLLNILATLRSQGVDFVSTTQAIDTTTSYGKMVMTFLGAIAEFERSLIVERVKVGIERAKSEGVRFGRPRVGFDVSRALQMKRQGRTWGQVARELGVAHSTVRRIVTPLLKSPVGETA